MPPLPPLHLVLEIGGQGLLLPLVVALAVGYFSVRFLGGPGHITGGLLAVVLGFLAGNFFREAVEFRLDSERPLAAMELWQAAWTTVTGRGVPNQAVPSSRYWLPWAALLGAVTGLLLHIPRLPSSVGWFVRVAAVFVMSRLLVGPALRAEILWLWPGLAAVLLGNWYVLDRLGRESTSRWLPSGLVWMSFTAATVLIHAHTARFTDIATILAGCWIGLALVAALRPAPQVGASATPLSAIALPGLMLVAQQSTFSEVPLTAFILAGIAPLFLVPLLFIPSARKQTMPYVVTAWALMLIPTLLAIALTVRAETLSFE